MSQSTLEQRRAAHALNEIKQLQSGNHYGNFTSYVDALPAAILTNGLGQAMATELAGKDKEGHRKLYEVIQSWLCGGDDTSPYKQGDNLIEAITNSSETDYLRAQPEALAYLVWLKKFARAFLEPGGGQDE
ncbi:MAG: type III-B CRISPR module-associated protein Cmr5 [Opitutales bacterium]